MTVNDQRPDTERTDKDIRFGLCGATAEAATAPFIPGPSLSELAVAMASYRTSNVNKTRRKRNQKVAAPQHARVIRTLSAHGPPISPAARRSRDRQPPSGTEVRSGPGGPGGIGRRRRLGSSSRPRPGAGDVGINLGLGELDPRQLRIA